MMTPESIPKNTGTNTDLDAIPALANAVEPMNDQNYLAVCRKIPTPNYIPSSSERTKRFDAVTSAMHAALGTLAHVDTYPADSVKSMVGHIENMYPPNISDAGVLTAPKNEKGIALLVTDPRNNDNYRYGKSFFMPTSEQRSRIQEAYLRYHDAQAHARYSADRALMEALDYTPADHHLEPLENGLAHIEDNRLRFELVTQNRFSKKEEISTLRTWQCRLLIYMRMPQNIDAVPQILGHQLAHANQLDQDPYCDFENDFSARSTKITGPSRSLTTVRENYAVSQEQLLRAALVRADKQRYSNVLDQEKDGTTTCTGSYRADTHQLVWDSAGLTTKTT